MARSNRAETARRRKNNARVNRGMYVEGNTVRRIAEVPDRRRQPGRQQPGRRKQTDRNRRSVQAAPAPAAVPKQKRQLSEAAQKNRQKATAMNWGFVVFLAVVCTAILFCSVNYLRYKSEITARMRSVANLDAYYSQVTSNVDLNQIKKTAIGRLGMRYPSDDQTVSYSTSGNSYVRQYQDVPDSK